MKDLEVLKLLKKVPKGRVTTYLELAKCFNSRAYRHIGRIMNKNSRPDLYPCYKVVNSNGCVGGYAGGEKQKIELLKKDGIKIKKDKVVNFEKILFKFK